MRTSATAYTRGRCWQETNCVSFSLTASCPPPSSIYPAGPPCGSRGEWSSKLCNLPAELSSLPFHSTGLPPTPPLQTVQQRPTKSASTSTSASPPASEDRHVSVTRKRAPSAGNRDVEPSEHEGGGAGGLKEKIGEAVAALGAAGRGLGGSRAGPGARTVTDEGTTLWVE